MKLRRLIFLCAPLLLLTVAGFKKPEQPYPLTQFELPNFSISVKLSEKAEKRLSGSKEKIIIIGYFAEEIGPDGSSLGRAEFELRGSGTAAFTNVKFSQPVIDSLRTPDYEVLINIFSRGRSDDPRLLRCDPDFMQGPISKFQKRSFSVNCDLVERENRSAKERVDK
jgi:hypothetical protein